MSRYLNLLYGSDTYGIRMRGEVRIRAQAVDYDRIRVQVDDLPHEYPTGARVALLRSLQYWPDSVGLDSAFSDPTPTDAVRTAVIGEYNDIPREFSDRVTAGTIVYYRMYVSEPMSTGVDLSGYSDPVSVLLQEREDALSADPSPRWTPWEIRGQTYVVVPQDFGGRRTFFDAFPTGILTGGDVYGTVDMASTQSRFLSHVGFLSDLVSTDGAHIIDQMDFLHPNMVRPMLSGFGMTAAEDANVNAYYATWDSLKESPYLKNLLFAYRDLTMRKGTSQGGVDYFTTAFRLPDIQISVPENLVLTVRDSSPMDLTTPGEVFDERSEPSDAPRIPDSTVMVEGAQWTRQYTGDVVKQGEAELWSDVFTSRWSNSPQDSLFIVEDLESTPLIPDVLGDPTADDWTAQDGWYEQHTDFVYQLKVPTGSTAVLGSAWVRKTYDGVQFPYPDVRYSIPLWEGTGALSFRFRVLREDVDGADLAEVQDVWAYADWSDIDGEYIGREYFALPGVAALLNSTPNSWHDAGASIELPGGARYVSWGILVSSGAGEPAVDIGAVHLSPFDTETYPVYRNPRSVIMLIDYQTDTPSALQVINAAKVNHDAENHLPIQVSHRTLTNLSGEWDEFSAPAATPVDPLAPTYASGRISYSGQVYDGDGVPIYDVVGVTYGHGTPIPDRVTPSP